MGNIATAAFLMAVAATSTLTMNKLIRGHPAVACVAALELMLGPTFIYLGFNTHIIL